MHIELSLSVYNFCLQMKGLWSIKESFEEKKRFQTMLTQNVNFDNTKKCEGRKLVLWGCFLCVRVSLSDVEIWTFRLRYAKGRRGSFGWTEILDGGCECLTPSHQQRRAQACGKVAQAAAHCPSLAELLLWREKKRFIIAKVGQN